MIAEPKIPIFTVPDVVRFLKWAVDHYRLEGVIANGDEAMIAIIYEHLGYKYLGKEDLK